MSMYTACSCLMSPPLSFLAGVPCTSLATCPRHFWSVHVTAYNMSLPDAASSLCPRRWALYPPGHVPPGATLRVDDDDGSVDYDSPTSLKVSGIRGRWHA